MKTSITNLIFISAIISLNIGISSAQILRTKNWHFGYNTSLRFEADTVIVDTSAIHSDESCTSLSDKEGNLLLYSDGVTVWNRKHQVIDNGSGLLGHISSSRGSVLLPFENKDSIFYLFTTDYQGNSNGLRYSKILNLGNDSFNIISKNNLLYTNVAEPIGAINHHDNIRQWIMARQFNGYDYYAYLLGQDGVIDCPVISKSTLYIGKSTNPVSAQNDCAFSPNGNKFASTYSTNYSTDIFEFNTHNGILNKNVFLENIRIPTGIQFSGNSRFLYVSEVQNSIIQYDLDTIIKSFIINNKYYIENTFNNKFDLQLSPKYELLLIQQGSQFYGKIKFPNSPDSSCNYILEGMPLGKAKWRYGLPNFNYSFFYTPAIDFSYEYNCHNNQFSFIAQDTFGANAYNWTFTNGSTTINQSGKKITLTLADTGNWQVQLIAISSQRSDTIIKNIDVLPLISSNFLGPDTSVCKGSKINLLLKTPPNMHCIHWMGKTGQDYENYHVDSLLVDSAGIYFVKITNKAFCAFYDTLQVKEIPKPKKPIISYLSNELASTEIATRYRWFYNDTLLIETTNHSIIPKQNGIYRLQFINDLGCESEISDSFWVKNIGIELLPNQSLFILYPNPSNGQIFIQVWNPNNYAIEITENTGKVVYKNSMQITDKASINTSLPSGNYYLKLTDKNGTSATKGFQIIN